MIFSELHICSDLDKAEVDAIVYHGRIILTAKLWTDDNCAYLILSGEYPELMGLLSRLK